VQVNELEEGETASANLPLGHSIYVATKYDGEAGQMQRGHPKSNCSHASGIY
jgi:hypothetical protein